ncbi:hypothetical protein [Amycolatopsis sp. H20-H5]|uniref:hypothetical protein n=1 Tax=Amycolatopsis sp. H20-H5 TaxID=3046309 RepID=UPI002DB8C78D|nr:hypothetical protein [Amycolatopsis sp. H20-H5]MEC3976715.1 hypothetical protein [Amycolatopsis sp. H20-H5]
MSTGRAGDGSIALEVAAGGGLKELTLDAGALRLGPTELARRVLALVDTATARANRRTRHSLADGLDEAAADALGLSVPAEFTEAAEATTPDSWRA